MKEPKRRRKSVNRAGRAKTASSIKKVEKMTKRSKEEQEQKLINIYICITLKRGLRESPRA
ncbi:MAG: hypothetical protein AAGJ80_01155 [Cyanobacteria bacterium J06553_1]